MNTRGRIALALAVAELLSGTAVVRPYAAEGAAAAAAGPPHRVRMSAPMGRLTRHLFTFCAAVSLLLYVTVRVVWVRS